MSPYINGQPVSEAVKRVQVASLEVNQQREPVRVAAVPLVRKRVGAYKRQADKRKG